MRRLAALSLAVLALGVAACGGDDEEDTATPNSSTATTEATTTAAPPPTTTTGGGSGDNEDLDQKPTVEVPDEPATRLDVEDIVEGEGPAAKAGDTVVVQYVGVAQSTGEEFDSSWSRNREPFPFTLGQGDVIPGWDEGIEGMRVGGRRKLVIPPDQAYGPQGQPPDIGPNETLVFVVDLEDIQ